MYIRVISILHSIYHVWLACHGKVWRQFIEFTIQYYKYEIKVRVQLKELWRSICIKCIFWYRNSLLTSAAQRMSKDGVKSVVYYRLALEYKQLYTWTYVGVKEGRIMEVIIQGVYYIINEAKLKNCYSIFRH